MSTKGNVWRPPVAGAQVVQPHQNGLQVATYDGDSWIVTDTISKYLESIKARDMAKALARAAARNK